MFNNMTKTFLLLTMVIVAVLGLSAVSAIDVDDSVAVVIEDAAEPAVTAEDVAPQSTDVSNNIQKKAINNVKQANTTSVQDNKSNVITQQTYDTYFDNSGTLKSTYNNADLSVSGEITGKVFIFDNVNVTLSNDGTSKMVDTQIFTTNNAKVIFNSLDITNKMDAIVLESKGNVINNSVIKVKSENETHAVNIMDDDNTIVNTVVDVTAPSGDVQYNSDYSTKAQAPTGIVVGSSNNLLDNVTVIFNAPTTTGYYPTVNGIHIGSVSGSIVANTLRDTKVKVNGTNYVYGINVGNAINTTLENLDVEVESKYYSNAIQLFDAKTIKVTGKLNAKADSEAYGTYATAMGMGYSNNIDLVGLNVTVDSPKSTGVLFEGARDAVISDAVFDIKGDTTSAVSAYVDWMGNMPSNITLKDVTANINPKNESDLLYFGQAKDITVTDVTLTSTKASNILFKNATGSKIVKSNIKNSTVTTCNSTDLTVDTVSIDNNNIQAIMFESDANKIKNSDIKVTNNVPLRTVEFAGNKNTIENTQIDATIPSVDVPYDKDFVGQPISSALYISSDNNVVNNVTVTVDGTKIANNASYATIDAVDLQSKGKDYVAKNNKIINTTIKVKGPNYVYGLNVGRAKDTTIENIDVDATSSYYADSIQLFDANKVSITGKVNSKADTQAYGVYSTAMGVGSSKDIDITGLDATVEAQDATGALFEGTSNINIANSTYTVKGNKTTAVNAHVDWMGNIPTNITVKGNDFQLEGLEDNNVMYFGKANDVTVTDNNIISKKGSEININATPKAKVTDNYILIGELSDDVFGDNAVITTEEDSVIKNNKPTVSEVIKNLTETIENLTAPKVTKTVFDPIQNNVFQNIKITGEVIAEDNTIIIDPSVRVTIDGVAQNVTTDGKGRFIVYTRFTSIGNKTIRAIFDATDKYLSSSRKTTITVLKNDVKIAFNKMDNVAYSDDAVITGTLTDSLGNKLYNTAVNATLGGKTITLKTDKEGVFTITTKAKTMGQNNVTVTFAGNTYFNKASETASYNVVKQDVIITLDDVKEVGYKEDIVITGKAVDANGNAIYNTAVKVVVNGKTLTVKTDKNGVFKVTSKATKIGDVDVKVNFEGNTYYNANTANTTAHVIKKDVTVKVTGFTYNKGKFTIRGTITDTDNNKLYSTAVSILLNGKKSVVKSDNNGNFVFNGSTKLNELTYTASFDGNSYYNAYEGTKTSMTFA